MTKQRKIRLGVLGSGKGSNMDAIAAAIREGKMPGAEIAVVISDVRDAGILGKAHAAGAEALYLDPGPFKTKLSPEAEREYVRALTDRKIDLVVLAGFMRVLKDGFLKAFDGRIVNIHPSLLPSFKGLCAWEQALKAGVKIAGCTVHVVNGELDGGRILMQAAVEVLPGDTAQTLHARIQEQEHRIYPEAIRRIAQNWAEFAAGREA